MTKFKLILRRCERSRLIAHISRGRCMRDHGSYSYVHFRSLLRLVVAGMMRVDRMFKRGAYKRNNRKGKSHLGVFMGRSPEGYINGSTDGRTNLGQGVRGSQSRAVEGEIRTESPFDR